MGKDISINKKSWRKIMGKRLFCLMVGCSCFLLSMVMAFGQPGGDRRGVWKENAAHLGKNYEVNLVLLPSEDKEGFTIVTATEHFLVETEVKKGEGQIRLYFEGIIKLKDSRMVIDDQTFNRRKPILTNYRIKIQADASQDAAGFAFELAGSALLEEDEEVVIASSKDMLLKLRVRGMEK
jgi:hypothetical protein